MCADARALCQSVLECGALHAGYVMHAGSQAWAHVVALLQTVLLFLAAVCSAVVQKQQANRNAGSDAGAAAANTAAAPGAAMEQEERLCVICLDALRTHAVVHAHSDDSHLCLCEECSRMIDRSDGCPVCRQVLSRIVRSYDC